MGYLEAEKVRAEMPHGAMKDAMREAVADAIEDTEHKKECEMGATNIDGIAGLLALMQNNKNLDLPGILALCKDKGYDKAWGGEGMFMFVFLMLFMMGNGGWWGMGRNNQQAVESIAGGQTRDLIALYDQLNQMAQANSNNFARQLQDMAGGFNQLDTKICSAIAETIAAVRNQGDRNYDATRNVGDAIRDCCCTMRALMAELGCKIDSLDGTVRLMQERTVNEIQKGNCALENRITALEGKMELGFERVNCHMDNLAQKQENERLNRRVAELEAKDNNQQIANAALSAMQAWTSQNYAFTRVAASPVVNSTPQAS